MEEFAIIVAGGRGSRMQSEIPKQFMLLNGTPILIHTLNKFVAYSKELTIILGLPKNQIPAWESLCIEHNFALPVMIVEGGESRFQTVKNCLNAIEVEKGLVAIHDGVRPLVDVQIIDASFRLASIHKTAVTSVRLKESIRKTTQDTTEAVDRSRYRLIQTPQTFDLQTIRDAYEMNEEPWMTDDASVAEAAGNSISLFEGDYNNIKITTPSDIIVAEAILDN